MYRFEQLVAVVFGVLARRVVFSLQLAQCCGGLGLRLLSGHEVVRGLPLPVAGLRGRSSQLLQLRGHLRRARRRVCLPRSQFVRFLAQFAEGGQRFALLAETPDLVGKALELRRCCTAVAPEGFDRFLQFRDAVFAEGFDAEF